MKCPILPVADYVVVEPRAPRARGRVVRSAAHALAPTRGVVVDFGPDVDRQVIKWGDEVAWRPHAGTQVEVGEGSWLLVREGDLICRLETECDSPA